jgi:hypothetical protein
MRQIFGSATREARYRITFGNDPAQVFPAHGGTIGVAGEMVEIRYKRAIVPFGRQHTAWPGWSRFCLFLYAILMPPLFIMSTWLTHGNSWYLLLGIIGVVGLAIGVNVSWISRRMRFRRSSVSDVSHEGTRVNFRVAKARYFVLRLATEEDAQVLELSLTDPAAHLPTPITFTSWHEPLIINHHRYGYWIGKGTLTIEKDRVIVAGTTRIPIYSTTAQKKGKRLAVVWLSVFFGIFLMGFTQGRIDIAIPLLISVGATFALLNPVFTQQPPVDKWEEATVTLEIPRSKLSHSRAYRGIHSYRITSSSQPTERFTLFTDSPEEADTLARALQPDFQPDEPVTYAVRFSPPHYHEYSGGFFDSGLLAIDGSEVTLTGRRGDTRPNTKGFWLTSALVYAGSVFSAWVLFPVLGSEMIPPEFKLTAILFVPMTAQLLLTVLVLGLLPLFVQQSQTYHLHQLTDVERRWRQIAFTVPDARGVPLRQTFYARTEEEAAGIAAMLRTTTGPARD